MLSINTIARVVVNTVRAIASPASFNTGLLLVRDSAFTASRRLNSYDSATAAAEGLVAMGFAATSEAYRAAIKYFAASPAPGRLLVSCYPQTGEALSDALRKVLELTSDFYGVMAIEEQSPTNLQNFVVALDALSQPLVLFVPVTGTVDQATMTGSVLDKLHLVASKRVVPFYCSAVSDCAAVMGTAMGLELSHPESAFALCYKTVQGILPMDLTQTQVDALKDLNCNVYVARGSAHHLLENGFVTNGQRYDEVLYVDKIAADLQAAAVTLLAENPDKMPQTDDSTAQFINRFSSILMNYTERSVLASSVWRGSNVGPISTGDVIENGFLLWAGSYDDQSDLDRAAHKAVPIQCALCLAGSIESIVITVNVQQ